MNKQYITNEHEVYFVVETRHEPIKHPDLKEHASYDDMINYICGMHDLTFDECECHEFTIKRDSELFFTVWDDRGFCGEHWGGNAEIIKYIDEYEV